MKIFQQLNSILAKYGVKGAIKLTLAAEGKLKDGTAIGTTAEEWIVGGDIYIVDAEGNQTPAPEGEHVLEDGRIIMVSPDGMIAEIKPAPEELEAELPAEVEEALNAMGEQLQAANKAKTDLEAELATTKAQHAAVSTELAAVKAENKKLKDAPGAPSVTDKKKPVEQKKETPKLEKTWDQMTVHERIMHNRVNGN